MDNTICEPMCGHCIMGYNYQMQNETHETYDDVIEAAKTLCYDTPGCGKFFVELYDNRTDAYLCDSSSAVMRSSSNTDTTYIMGNDSTFTISMVNENQLYLPIKYIILLRIGFFSP